MAKIVYEKVGFKKEGMWVTIDGKREWMWCVGNKEHTGKQVKDLAKKLFKDGDEIQLEYTKEGENYNVQSIILDKNSKQSFQDTKSSTKSSSKSTSYHQEKTGSSVTVSIERQCACKATAQVLIALESQVTLANVEGLIDTIYDKLIGKIEGK